jgi:hypothetical protein
MEFLLKVFKSSSLDVMLYINGKHYATIKNGTEERWLREHKSITEEMLFETIEVREGVISACLSVDTRGIKHAMGETVMKVYLS